MRELKSGLRRDMRRTGSPKRTWCFCGKWIAAITRLTALNLPQLKGRVAVEQVLGFTPDISSYAHFDWYQHVYYWDLTNGFWLGVAEVAMDVMAYFVLAASGKVLIRKSVWGLSKDDCNVSQTCRNSGEFISAIVTTTVRNS